MIKFGLKRTALKDCDGNAGSV